MRSCFIDPGRGAEAEAGRAGCVFTLKRFDTLVRLVKKTPVEVVGIFVCGFMTQVVDQQGFCVMNGKKRLIRTCIFYLLGPHESYY